MESGRWEAKVLSTVSGRWQAFITHSRDPNADEDGLLCVTVVCHRLWILTTVLKPSLWFTNYVTLVTFLTFSVAHFIICKVEVILMLNL